MERRTRWIAPIGGMMFVGLLALLALPGCGGGDAETPSADEGGGEGGVEVVDPVDVPPASEAGDAAEPTPVDEDFERRARNAAAAERQRAMLIEELIDLPASRFTSAADVAILIPAENPPRLFRLDEADLEAMPPAERTEAVARYDRLARGLVELAARAIAEATRLRVAGDDETATDLLERIRGLAAVSGNDDVAEIGRDAARAVVASLDAALAEGG